jgi:hypothetical protein
MNQRTRYFFVGSSLVMIVTLCTGLFAYYNGALPARVATGPSELAYIPSDATAVAYANVRTVMDSEFRQRLKEMLPTGEAQDDLKEELGLDLEHDIDTVVAGFTGDPTKPGGVVVVRGRFDQDMMETKAVAHGAAPSEYRGIRLLLSPEMSHDADGDVELPTTAGVAFLEPGLMALGDEGTLKRAIDAAADRQDVTQNQELMAFVAEMELGSSAWIVSRVDPNTLPKDGIPEQLQAQVGAVKWVMANANINGGLSGRVRAEANDDEAAEQLRDLVRGGLAAMRLMGGEDQRIQTLINSIQLQGAGRTVAVQFSLSPEVLDVLNGFAGISGDGGGGVRK